MDELTKDNRLSHLEVTEKLGALYHSEEYLRLTQKMTSKTYLHSISKEESETVYSSFIGWILGNPHFNALPDSPLHNLMRLLAVNAMSGSNTRALMSQPLAHAILSNEFSISDISVDKEVSTTGKNNKKGKIDIVVSFTWTEKQQPCRLLIENKVYSKEHDQQCTTYYKCFSEDKTRENIFCYLSIDKSETISDSHYIRINYQELLEWVLLPLNASRAKIPVKHSVYLEDFIDTITSIKSNGKPQIAMDDDTAALLRRFYEKNKDLIRAAILQSEDDEMITAVEKSESIPQLFDVDFPNREKVRISGLANLVYEVIKQIAVTTPSNVLIADFARLGQYGGKHRLLSKNENDYIDGKGTKRHLSAAKKRSDIVCADGTTIYCSNQLAYDKASGKDNITPFIEHVNKGNYGIKINIL